MEVHAKLKAVRNSSLVRVQQVLQEVLVRSTSMTASRILVRLILIVKTRSMGILVNATLLSREIAAISVSIVINHWYIIVMLLLNKTTIAETIKVNENHRSDKNSSCIQGSGKFENIKKCFNRNESRAHA